MNRDRMTRNRTGTVLTLAALVMAALVLPAAAAEVPAQLPGVLQSHAIWFVACRPNMAPSIGRCSAS